MFPANFVTFTKEIVKGKLHFLCSAYQKDQSEAAKIFFFTNAFKNLILSCYEVFPCELS